MKSRSFYRNLLEARNSGTKQLAVLVDPDSLDPQETARLGKLGARAQIEYFFVGGSLLMRGCLDDCLEALKENAPDIPVVLFPGSTYQVSDKADAILFLSLISGRNPEYLIGQHVMAAPFIRKSGLEVISTGYVLIDGGSPSSVAYMSNTRPIPAGKCDLARSTVMAGEMLGMRAMYLDAGSGAKSPVSRSMIESVREVTELPLIVGGGIRSAAKAVESLQAGADLIVVGNGLEKDPYWMEGLSDAIKRLSASAELNAGGRSLTKQKKN